MNTNSLYASLLWITRKHLTALSLNQCFSPWRIKELTSPTLRFWGTFTVKPPLPYDSTLTVTSSSWNAELDRQGDMISPRLFTSCLQDAIISQINREERGIQISGEHLSHHICHSSGMQWNRRDVRLHYRGFYLSSMKKGQCQRNYQRFPQSRSRRQALWLAKWYYHYSLVL